MSSRLVGGLLVIGGQFKLLIASKTVKELFKRQSQLIYEDAQIKENIQSSTTSFKADKFKNKSYSQNQQQNIYKQNK